MKVQVRSPALFEALTPPPPFPTLSETNVGFKLVCLVL